MEVLKNVFSNVLIIGFVWPEPNSSAAGGRMIQLIQSLQAEDAHITFASPAADSDFMMDVRELGIEKVSIELNNSSFDEFIRELQPTLVLFDRFMIEEQFGWRVVKECPNALRILDTEDLHCLRSARQKASKENRPFHFSNLNSNIAKREIASILRCDLSLMISTYEMEILQNHFKIDPSLLLYLPFMLDAISQDEQTNWPTFEERKDFIFIGNFLHEPNWDAVRYLKESIWPLIHKKIPQAEIHIYGAYPSQKVTDLRAPKQGFIIKGRAENSKGVVSNARICLVPLRFGAGIKGKLIEAMRCGTPSVTTSVGAESMHADLPWNGTITDSPEEIANAAIELYSNQILWQEAQKNGIEIISKCYSKTKNHSLFIQCITDIAENMEEHRSQNFIGSMLMHHTLASTKYMSMWIEEKNK